MKNNILYHIGLWVFFWAMPILLGQYMNSTEQNTIPFQTIFQNLVTLICTSTCISYINYYSLTTYFNKQKYLTHTVVMCIVWALGTLIFYQFLVPLPGDPPFARGRHIAGSMATVILSTLFWFAQKGYIKELEFKEAKAKRVEAEMSLLKMQIQPHFLFNTLNNLYAVNLKTPAKANEMILQLADLLRYQLELTKQEKINLSEEIKLTQNYVALEKIRLHNCEVLVELDGDFQGFQITPLLFLPLIENAFKYSADIDRQRIHIHFDMQDNKLVFECHNTIGKQIRVVSNKMGLENVRKRLEILYPEKHDLRIQKLDNNFIITLILWL